MNPVHTSNPISLMYMLILLSLLGLYLPSGLVHIFLPNIMHISLVLIMFLKKGKSVPLQAEVPRGFQEVKVPRLSVNDTGWW